MASNVRQLRRIGVIGNRLSPASPPLGGSFSGLSSPLQATKKAAATAAAVGAAAAPPLPPPVSSCRCYPGSRRAFSTVPPSPHATNAAEKAEAFARLVTDTKFAVLSSTSNNPFVNLSIEHYLLQKSRPDSVIFFNYVNRPCVVIGRNQNPWLEVNLEYIDTPAPLHKWLNDFGPDKENHADYVDLVRRRSGGGTVFHDEGNMNYSVISPKDDFTRNKYAEMVVRALRSLNPRARVNERHDIVLDQGKKARLDVGVEPSDTHRTVWEDADKTPLKVSGSAFKMTRERALHHGTCLLHSPNLPLIHNFLRSPAAPYIKALGVDSVRSPVGNASEYNRDTALHEFREALTREFFTLHGIQPDLLASQTPEMGQQFDQYRLVKLPGYAGQDLVFGWVDEDHAELAEIRKGMEELADLDWVYGQTPRFTFSSHPTDEDPRERPEPEVDGSVKPRVSISTRSGTIEEAHVAWSDGASSDMSFEKTEERQDGLVGTKIYEIEQVLPMLSVSETLSNKEPKLEGARRELSKWLTKTLVDPAGLYQDQQDQQEHQN